MSRRMWPYAAVVKYSVRATYEQAGRWGCAAKIKGLPEAVFLALAADIYAEHLERVHARWERAEARRKERAGRIGAESSPPTPLPSPGPPPPGEGRRHPRGEDP